MNANVKINRLKTGVPGLDEVLGGGLPEYSFNLIAGAPGCGKTTLAHQMMFALATPEQPALYLTVLGEPPLKMLRYQQQFDFFDNDRIATSLFFVNLSEDVLAGNLDQVMQTITRLIETKRPRYVFVDSFRSIALSRHPEGLAAGNLQRFVQELAMLMTSWQATTFLIGEYATDAESTAIFTIADGIVWMRQAVDRDSMVRKLEVKKMRGQAALPGLHTFRIDRSGINVFAPAHAMTTVSMVDSTKVGAARLRMGVPLLDEMLGGGLPSGYSLLVAGPSGSGKSILATAFLAEGVRSGESGVLVAFEQNPFRSRDRVVADLIKGGHVGLISTRASDLSIPEVSQLLIAEIRRRGAKRVVIDSLSGFELALAPTFRADFRESLANLVTALASTGATIVMTSELEDRYTDLRFSPYGTAFLTDAIIVQRYIELDSRLRRVMAVVKVRASVHSHELREFTIDATGLRIGEMLPDEEGLLGGRPTHKRPPARVPAAARDEPSDGGDAS
jgi:circadian clock protein KaiC